MVKVIHLIWVLGMLLQYSGCFGHSTLICMHGMCISDECLHWLLWQIQLVCPCVTRGIDCKFPTVA